jgi:hypothetical protein
MVGLRLQRQRVAERVQPYFDVLIGVGYIEDDAASSGRDPGIDAGRKLRDHANVSLSFGTGIKLQAFDVGGLFADVHYDFYFTETSETPVVPVRFGITLPKPSRSTPSLASRATSD